MQHTMSRSPIDYLVSETFYRIFEVSAVFQRIGLEPGSGPRWTLLNEFLRRAEQDYGLKFESDSGEPEILISAKYEPAGRAGSPFCWHKRGEAPPLLVYPLADWDEQAVMSALESPNWSFDHSPLIKVCVVGDTDSGKSELLAELLSSDSKDREDFRPRYFETDGRLIQFRETRGRHASDVVISAAAWESDAALLTIDASSGLTPTTRRIIFLLALSGVENLIAVVTQMERYSGDQKARYQTLTEELNHLLTSTTRLSLSGVILLSPDGMDWYEGSTLRSQLGHLPLPSTEALEPFRLSIQGVHDGSIYGRISAGTLRIGDDVVLLPSGEKTKVRSLALHRNSARKAKAGDWVVVELEGSLDISSGNLLVHNESFPTRSSELDATVLWVDSEPPAEPYNFTLFHRARTVTAQLAEVKSTLSPETYEWREVEQLEPGQVAHVGLMTSSPLFFDPYFEDRVGGRFLLLHEELGHVVGLGIIRGRVRQKHEVSSSLERLRSDHVVIDPTKVPKESRRETYGHRAAVLWFTGLSGSGKSAAAKETEEALFKLGCHTLFLDGDNVRSGFNGDLGFTQEDRSESNRRVAEVAALACEQGQIVICSFISGQVRDRDFARTLLGDDFLLFHVDCPVEVCAQRDPKGLYEKAEAGELLSFTGISVPYEKPEDADLVLDSDAYDPIELRDQVLELLTERGILFSREPQ